jgi:amino acid permease
MGRNFRMNLYHFTEVHIKVGNSFLYISFFNFYDSLDEPIFVPLWSSYTLSASVSHSLVNVSNLLSSRPVQLQGVELDKFSFSSSSYPYCSRSSTLTTTCSYPVPTHTPHATRHLHTRFTTTLKVVPLRMINL